MKASSSFSSKQSAATRPTTEHISVIDTKISFLNTLIILNEQRVNTQVIDTNTDGIDVIIIHTNNRLIKFIKTI